MRLMLLAALVLAVGCGKKLDSNTADTSAPNPEPVPKVPRQVDEESLHSEKGVAASIEIDRRGHYTRLVVGGVLHGSQVNEKFVRHWADDFGCLVPGSPWDVVITVGRCRIRSARSRERITTAQDRLRDVPRTGTRKGEEDAKHYRRSRMKTGTQACYALPGQKVTFYETDPAIKRLVADTNKYFTYVSDARKRGAEIEIRVGNRREKLKEDKDRKYALLLVDPFDSEAIPVELLTKEAVQLYFDRMTDDGVLALHISSKTVKFEPMVARIAEELKLTTRGWEDNTQQRPGKTWSNWVVLAKSEKTLGTLALPLPQQFEYGTKFQPLTVHRDVPGWTDTRAEVVPAMKRR